MTLESLRAELAQLQTQIANMKKTRSFFRNHQQVTVTIGNPDDIKRFENRAILLEQEIQKLVNPPIQQIIEAGNTDLIQASRPTTPTTKGINPVIWLGVLVAAVVILK